MSGSTFNTLFDPSVVGQPPQNGLAPQPTWADAWQFNAEHAQAELERQRAISEQRGLWGPDGPTLAGARDAAQQYGQGLLFGTTAPIVPKLTSAMRVGSELVTGANHQALTRDYPDIASHPDSELGFVNPVGRWLTRPEAFKYALDHDLIDPKRVDEAQRFKNAMEETGNVRNLFLPSEWLRK